MVLNVVLYEFDWLKPWHYIDYYRIALTCLLIYRPMLKTSSVVSFGALYDYYGFRFK